MCSNIIKKQNEMDDGYLEQLQSSVAEIVADLDVTRLQTFVSQLNQNPPMELVQINKYANNTKYLPISYLEMLLDQLFLGGWEVVDFRYEILMNELVGTLTLRYYHPLFNCWLQRIGTAAVQIQTNKGTDPYDIKNKIPNTLVKQMGQLKAECFRNACKSLGKLFGRDLNREQVAEFNNAYDDDELTIKLTKQVMDAIKSTQKAIKNNKSL